MLNNFSGFAYTTGQIKISDVTPWSTRSTSPKPSAARSKPRRKPCTARSSTSARIPRTTASVRDIAEIVARVFPNCQLSFGTQGADNRSYKVSFDKIHDRLPGFTCDWDAESGARQLLKVFQSIELTKEDFEQRSYTRLKQLQYLLRTRQIDQRFFWQSPA